MGVRCYCKNMGDNIAQNELLCSYASLILASADMDVTADNINSLVGAAGGSVPSFYPALFEKVNAACTVKEMVKKAGEVGSGGGGGGAAAPAAGGGGAAAAAAVEEEEEEEEMAPAANLFGDDGDDY